MADDVRNVKDWLSGNYAVPCDTPTQEQQQLEPNTWTEIRLFISSTFVDTQAERDVIIKHVIPAINRIVASRFIRITPVDLRWGVLAEESKNCEAIQKTCLNQLDRCRLKNGCSPWFLGLRSARYGWVQNRLEKSENFDHPDYYEWLDKFQETGKEVSITSLECIHATLPPNSRTPTPTVFFYERKIQNPEDIETFLRWVFEFEYVPEDIKLDPDVQFQYAKTNNANIYDDDKEKLDEYMRALPHVRYSDYECRYEKGGARFTAKNEGRKSFGVGYVTGLEQFAELVQRDLLEAIETNFKDADISNIPMHIIENTQHEVSIRSKASTFVGRSELFQACIDHCLSSTTVDNNVLILHGVPGCGKSALWAAVAQRCISDLRKNGDFVFTHAVDSSPGSNILEGMLKRLQINLRYYRKELGENNIPLEAPSTSANLKSSHNKFLEECALKYPEKKFVVLVDAVNQFHDSLQAWKMWWLPPKDSPPNLRVIISTLNEENGTFNNACNRAPNSKKVLVDKMSYDDRQMMVAAYLERYKKKLTTFDDPFLGNQMENLLSKSDSPLYLMAATEALRKFGIFEQMKDYIAKLPMTINSLFNMLLDEWSAEYGGRFTWDVSGFICVSRDGLLENEINDILSYKEQEEGIPYDCSFSRLYDSICTFLAAGGGGFLRFFHDQLKYEVRRKFLSEGVEQQLHEWLVKFFLSFINPQLCAHPTSEPPAYYAHGLNEVAYHQLEGHTENFLSTLRNIFFVRERVKYGQDDSLQHEYSLALRKVQDEKEKKALKDWSKFAQLYAPFIREFPEWSYNMALNQTPTSSVALDTTNLKVDETNPYHLYWTNIPDKDEDALVLRYTPSDEECFSCTTDGMTEGLCCVGASNKAFLYEAESGVLLHEVAVRGSTRSVFISPQSKTFMTGDDNCSVYVWCSDTGVEQWNVKVESKREGESRVVWIGRVGKFVGCGISGGTIALLDEEQRSVVKTWSTKKWAFSFTSIPHKSIILSGHDGVIRIWNTDGEKIGYVNIGPGDPWDLDVNPSDDNLLLCAQFNKVQIVNLATGEFTALECDANRRAVYDREGGRIIITDEENNILVLNAADGRLLNRMKSNTDGVRQLCVNRHSGELMTACTEGSMLFDIPLTPDENLQDKSEEEEANQKEVKIEWCEFVECGNKLLTLNEDSELQLLETSTLKQLGCVSKVLCATVTPDDSHIVACGNWDLKYLEIPTLETLATYDVGNIIQDETMDPIRGVYLSHNGKISVLTSIKHGVIILDVNNYKDIKHISSYGVRNRVFDCAIHADNERAVIASEDLIILRLSTGQLLNTLKQKRTYHVTFLYNPDRLLYADDNSNVRIMDMNCADVMTFPGCRVPTIPPTLRVFDDNRRLVTGEEDGTLRVYDIVTGEMCTCFVDHRSVNFVSVAVHPSNECIVAGNFNKMMYVLKNVRK